MTAAYWRQMERWARREGWCVSAQLCSKRHVVLLTYFKDRPTAVMRNPLLAGMCCN